MSTPDLKDLRSRVAAQSGKPHGGGASPPPGPPRPPRPTTTNNSLGKPILWIIGIAIVMLELFGGEEGADNQPNATRPSPPQVIVRQPVPPQNPVPLVQDTLAAAARPSFDCGRARTASEITICGSPYLANLDRQLADAYGAQLRLLSGSAREGLVDSQISWLNERQACGSNAQCMADLYISRRETITRWAAPVTNVTIEKTIRAIQQELDTKGCSPGPVDGLMGRRTLSAIERFGSANGRAWEDPRSQLADILSTLQQKSAVRC